MADSWLKPADTEELLLLHLTAFTRESFQLLNGLVYDCFQIVRIGSELQNTAGLALAPDSDKRLGRTEHLRQAQVQSADAVASANSQPVHHAGKRGL